MLKLNHNIAEKYVAKNENPSSASYKMGAKNAQPGEAIDCSGLVSMCVKAGGESDPNKGVEGGQRKENGGQSGVLNIEDNTTKVNTNDLQVGNLITWRIDKGYPYHVGIVTGVEKDDDGNVTNVTFIHSSGSKGPNEQTFKVGDGTYYERQVHGYYKWDTKPDLAKSTNTDVQNQVNTSTPESAAAKAQYKESKSSSSSSWDWSLGDGWNKIWNETKSGFNKLLNGQWGN